MPNVKYTWENPANQRYYVAYLQCDLLGDWVLVKQWGRRGTGLGRQQSLYCENYQQGLQRLEKLDKLRRSHGYQKT